ncbi:LytTR family transcriptional regulator DNA-binding domain-containing protein [Aquimarina rubra]|uniref:LytTR family transcriptional regulator DNA-binding domain-containing protein n=1 Tax=Aquimarina rubra TaxID=1920033 RepID=A0ABW5LF82_9FLAO
MKSLNLNTSYKHHTIVAFIIGVWLALFLVLIAPFDASDLSFLIRLQILPFYGVITFLSYLILIPVQNVIFKKIRTWNIALEIAYIIVYNIIALVGCYLYYKTDIINGTYQFQYFTLNIYYPIFFVLLAVLVFSRWFLNKKVERIESEKIFLKGDNKLDVLQIELSNLISVSSADNYVEINYLKDGILIKKLLRTTLKNIHSVVPSLVQVHRSHLINPSQFIDWKDSSTLRLTQVEVPVSKKYKKDVLFLNHSPQKSNHSPQSH